ncbi:hypothetical protein BpHYR1_025720 [Brachionus plicatilis]|uniref:Uncharacterized protein n=1 Tax=Brachionus plicatilis TaxID=10195 RepID=A0A3M7SHE5_BRAPC|nr:hypothetical protein BpHYR1_025720 [Brachionus plicatilis]
MTMSNNWSEDCVSKLCQGMCALDANFKLSLSSVLLEEVFLAASATLLVCGKGQRVVQAGQHRGDQVVGAGPVVALGKRLVLVERVQRGLGHGLFVEDGPTRREFSVVEAFFAPEHLGRLDVTLALAGRVVLGLVDHRGARLEIGLGRGQALGVVVVAHHVVHVQVHDFGLEHLVFFGEKVGAFGRRLRKGLAGAVGELFFCQVGLLTVEVVGVGLGALGLLAVRVGQVGLGGRARYAAEGLEYFAIWLPLGHRLGAVRRGARAT